MYSGAPALLERLRPVLETFSANIFNIGPEPGQGQRMKLVNNCLVISAFVNTSQALAYGEKGGIDLKTMLDVVNVSTGQNFVTKEYFPRFALNGSFDSAGANAIICKDLSLFIEEAEKEGSFNEVAKSMLKVLEALEETRPGADQMLLYPFLRDGR
jgi:3-hydroxyisobutyrate dehydrogenase-like beta-hydroxyacid dehydrogenase